MRILIAEDDFSSRKMLQTILSPYGDCDVAVDGKETISAFEMAIDADDPYDLICLDIMMPRLDGREALRQIRGIEDEKKIMGDDKVKVIMTTALQDPKSIVGSFMDQCEAYLVKPILKKDLLAKMKLLGLI